MTEGRPDDEPIRLSSKAERQAAVGKLRTMHEANVARALQEAAERAAQTPICDDDAGELKESDRLMLDPSFLFSAEGIAWLKEEVRRSEEIVISSAFARWLRSGDPADEVIDLVHPEDRAGIDRRRAELFELLRGTPAFGAEGAELAEQDEEVLLALQEPGGLVGEILADEWAFLQSHSWALSKVHLPLDRFRDAGAVVLEYGVRLRERMISTVIPQKGAPPAVTPGLLAKASAKWLVVGGAGVGGAFLGPVVAGLVGSGVAVPVVQAFDP
ncbi:MAG TPA: hypothetical protein VN522_10220 [Solirubrobacterales bacterium]|nr:hypothetical protein [Solirubrobacterales bacterium]